jgi:hypothetical protein
MVYWFILAVIAGVTIADAILRILKRKRTSDLVARDSSPFATKFMKRV